MRKIMFMLFAVCALWSCGTSDTYTLSGTIGGEVKGDLYLKKFSTQGRWVNVDTAKVVDGKFEMTGSIASPEYHMLLVGNNKPVSMFFLENSNIKFTADIDSVQNTLVEGSDSHDIFKIFMDEYTSIQKKVSDLNGEFRSAQASGNEDKMKEIKIDFDATVENMNVFVKNFAKGHLDSPVSAFVIYVQQNNVVPMKDIKEMLSSWKQTIPECIYVKELEKRVKTTVSTAVGELAPDFVENTPEGKPLKLSSLRGQYVLIDFWASWCGPCRRENPNVVKLYEKYHNKGFEILGVSLDKDKSAWVKAIADDNLTWPQVSDLKQWQSKVAKMYNVKSIPHTILLDKEGKIVAKNLRGEALAQKLAELMN